ncbi:MAG: glycosyltransferase family 39 protein [Candidatus Altiarchaeota archaeon]|nr:glycosyltransferase family 39 protein [Candidatus Altiarchaeota archaeon]
MANRRIKKVGAFERVLGLNVWVKAGLVFASGFIARVLLDLLFMLDYGWHAVNHIETWFYYGVSQGSLLPANGLADPTSWILRLGGILLPGELSFYYVLLLSAALSALTAAALFLLAREEWGDEAGLAAGLIYAFMVEPLSLSLMGFTHDHLQLLLFVVVLLSCVKAVKSAGRERVVWAGAYVAVAYLGLSINDVMKVALGVSLLYAANAVAGRILSTKDYRVLFALLLAAMIFGGFFILPSMIEGSLELMPQGRSGSVDIAPIAPSNFWLRFNVLIALLPLGLYVGYVKRDVNGLALAIFGLALCTVMDRGARILDLGLTLSTAGLLRGWNKSFTMYAGVLALIVFGFFLTQSSVSLAYNVVFVAAGLLLFAVIAFEGMRMDKVLLVLALIGLAANLNYVYTIDSKKITPEAEYDAFKWLQSNYAGGKVLVGWDHGYYLNALTGLTAVSTPNKVEYGVHDALWLPEKQAALELKNAGVGYVVISDRNFNIIKTGGSYSFVLSGGLVLEPAKAPPIELVEYLTAYKLRNGQDLHYFVKVHEEVDNSTGIKIMVYGVDVNESLPSGEVPVTVFLMNSGGPKAAEVAVEVTDGVNSLSGFFNTTVSAEGVSEQMYTVKGNVAGALNCSASVRPSGAEKWGYSGSMTYVNEGPDGDYNISIALVDNTLTKSSGVKTVEDKIERQLHFTRKEKKTIDYEFNKKYQDHQYVIAHKHDGNLTWVEAESSKPVGERVDALYAFC